MKKLSITSVVARALVAGVCIAGAGPLAAVSIFEGGGVPGIQGMAVDREGDVWYASSGILSTRGRSGLGDDYVLNGATSLKEVAVGADGRIWVTETGQNRIWRFNPYDFTYQQLVPPSFGSGPAGITAGPDGNIWFTEFSANRIGRINTGTLIIDEFPIPTADSQPNAITVGTDGNLWFTEFSGNKLGVIDRNGKNLHEYPLPNANAFPAGLACRSGTIVFTQVGANAIGVFDIPIKQFLKDAVIPTPSASPQQIALGPDHLFWFTEFTGNKIGVLSLGLPIVEYALPTADAHPYAIATGREYDVWFGEVKAGRLCRVDLFLSGDVNGDGKRDVSDVFYLVNFLFGGGPAPK